MHKREEVSNLCAAEGFHVSDHLEAISGHEAD